MFSGEMLPAIGRNSITACLGLMLYPLVRLSFPDNVDENMFWFVGVVAKEAVLGLFIGFTISLGFWIIGSVGFFIDNQRGASMASSINPMLGDQASPLGTFLTQTITTILFVSGAILVLINGIYETFIAWPPTEFFPTLKLDDSKYFLNQFDAMFSMILLLGGPIVGCMFIAEFGLGLVGRFAPQLNVFFLAMPIKSGIALVILIFSVPILMRLAHEKFIADSFFVESLEVILR